VGYHTLIYSIVYRLIFVGSVAGPGARVVRSPGAGSPPGQAMNRAMTAPPCNDLPDIQDHKSPLGPWPSPQSYEENCLLKTIRLN